MCASQLPQRQSQIRFHVPFPTMTRKIIAVLGATGAQGGGLVRAILNHPSGGFAARAITRDAHSAKARELAALGAEVVAADVDDELSLLRAFDGAHGAYCVTFYWAHFSPEKELAQAAAMARAAKAAEVKHVVWSTLEDTRRWVPLSDDRMPTLQGKYKVPHLDAKGEADAFVHHAEYDDAGDGGFPNRHREKISADMDQQHAQATQRA
jgi:hypothetical protein